MKRIVAILLCLALLAGCGSNRAASGASSAAESSSQAAAATPEPTAEPTPTPPPVQPLTGEDPSGEAARPAAVMIDNSVYAQTQWGLADADVVVEALTEGKSTNLCLWYGAAAAMPKVGPVSEGKDLFWQFAIPYNTVPVQKGMNPYAENLLNCYAWQPVDALYVGVNGFDYDRTLAYGVPDAYRWYTSGGAVQNAMTGYGLAAAGSAQPLFCFGKAAGGSSGAARVDLLYSAERSTTFQYDAASGRWQMFNSSGDPQTDANTGAQAAFTNLVLLRCATGVKDDKFTREYDLTGGSGWYLTGDTWQPITWEKGDVLNGLTLYDADGAELTVNVGTSYIGIYGVSGQRMTLTGADGAALAVDTADGTAYPAQPTPEPTAAPAG